MSDHIHIEKEFKTWTKFKKKSKIERKLKKKSKLKKIKKTFVSKIGRKLKVIVLFDSFKNQDKMYRNLK